MPIKLAGLSRISSSDQTFGARLKSAARLAVPPQCDVRLRLRYRGKSRESCKSLLFSYPPSDDISGNGGTPSVDGSWREPRTGRHPVLVRGRNQEQDAIR